MALPYKASLPMLFFAPFSMLISMIALPTGAQTANGAVPVPRSFEAVAMSPQEIRCYWLPTEGATGYRLERDGQPLVTLPANVQEYDDKSLSPGSVHHYRIQTLRDNVVSTFRDDVDSTFAFFPLTPPTAKTRKPSSRLPASSFDVVVVQASSGGVSAAVEAARRGLKVALVEPTTRLGGMPVNGLSATDLRREFHASGFLVRFRDRVAAYYAQEGVKTNGLRYEPRIAHQAMKSLVFEQPNITLFRHARLARVQTQRSAFAEDRKRVEAVQIEELNAQGQPTGGRAELRAKVFVDATDCGDLAAWAGAPFRIGREARSAQEPHNGVIYYNRKDGSRLPGSTGEGDTRIQSYAYLFVVKDYGPDADKTIPKPAGYRKEDFEHAPSWKESWAVTSGKLPQNKYELNQHPQGGDLQEINYHYSTGDYTERDQVEKRYHDHVLGYLYYIQTEQGQKQLGLPDDEYRDTGGFPPLLYVREGRRILGEQLPVEADITNALKFSRPESVGIGDYPMDSHAVRVKTDWNSPDMGEGEWWLYQETPWHQLPVGVMIPRTLDNVFVTTAVSSTHVSFGTYRLEPVRMAFGQAAGIAADLCIRYRKSAREVPARQIQDEMLPHVANLTADPNVMLAYLSDVKPDSPHYRAIQYLAARGFRFGDETFKPDAPTTRGELATMLVKLAERAAPGPRLLYHDSLAGTNVYRRAYYPYMGQTGNLAAAQALLQEPDATVPATRGQFAIWLARVLDWQPEPSGQSPLYADLPAPEVEKAAGILQAHFITSELWDGLGHRTPEGKLRFNPDAPLTHAALFETLFLAQLGLGPVFNDSPVDGVNGRTVPSAVYETIAVPIR